MIPKIIHYCWFGGGLKSDLNKKCIASWRKCLPEYEFIEWNESNFDVGALRYTQEAYQKKNWAYVSDVARLKAMRDFGGFYLDTDVEVFSAELFETSQKFSNLLVFENARGINTGMFCACEKGSILFRKFLDAYTEASYPGRTNVRMNKEVIERQYPKLKWNNETQQFGSDVFLSHDEYDKTMRHYGEGSWIEYNIEGAVSTRWGGLKRLLRNPLIFEKLEGSKLLGPYEFVAYDLLDYGPMYFLKIKIQKFRNLP